MNQLLIERLKIAGYIFALVGWLLLVTVPLEMLGKDLSKIESMFETTWFKWSLRVVVLLLIILLVKGQSLVGTFLNKHVWLQQLLKIVVVVGMLGWVVGLGSLFWR